MKLKDKYIVLLGDGMADRPLNTLDGMTPLEYARTPNMDDLASRGVTGMVRTVPRGMPPGSDTANLSVFSYDPERYYSGRAPLEALNKGIELAENDAAFRCNLVSLKDGIMEDFTAGHVEDGLAEIVLREIEDSLGTRDLDFHAGVSYRHLLHWKNYPHDRLPETVPPHDITDRQASPHLPSGPGSDILRELMERGREVMASSREIAEVSGKFRGHPTDIWLWGAGRRPAIDTLQEKFGLIGHTISAVDLIHGIGRAAGLSPLNVPGATGYLDTDYEGKTRACLDNLEETNFIYLHVEAPDESGHEGNIEHKVKAIEDFDSRIVGPVMEGLSGRYTHTLLVMPDHPTPIELRTHSDDPVPFLCFDSRGRFDNTEGFGLAAYNEKVASKSGLYLDRAHQLLGMIIEGRFR